VSTSFFSLIIILEVIAIAYLYRKLLFVPRKMIGALDKVRVTPTIHVSSFPVGNFPEALGQRFKQRLACWASGRSDNTSPSLEPIGRVFLEEDFYTPRKVNAAPGAMSGMGILGTFLGLTLGLGSLELDSSKTLMVGIKNLLDGLSIAAWSSVIGIAASLVFTVWSRVVTHEIRNQCDRLNHELDQIFPCVTPGQAVLQLLNAQGKTEYAVTSIQTSFREEFPNILSAKLEERLKAFQNEIASELAGGMLKGADDVLKRFNDNLLTVLEASVPLAEKTQELIKSTDEIVTKQQPSLEKMEAILPTVSDSVTQLTTAAGLFSEITTKVSSLVGEQSAATKELRKISGHLQKAVKSVDSSVLILTQLPEPLKELTQRFDRSVDTFAGQTETRLSETFTTFDKQLAALVSRLVKVADELADTLDRIPTAAQRTSWQQHMATTLDRSAGSKATLLPSELRRKS